MMRISALLCFLFLFSLNAGEIALKKGESRVFNTTSDISTIFTSDPKVVNYNVIGTRKVVIFATNNGSANVKAFGNGDSDLLLSVDILVDPVAGQLSRIARLIQMKNPGTKNIKIDRLSIPDPEGKKDEQGYVISGEVPDEETKDVVYKMAVLALGLKFDESDVEPQDSPRVAGLTEGSDGGGGGASSVAKELMQEASSSQLIDRLKLPKKNLVNIEVIIAEVDKTVLETLGIDLQGGIFKFPVFHPLGNHFPGQVGQGGRAIPGQTYDVMRKKGYKFINPIDGVLEAIKDEKVGRILAKPSLSVLSGKQAYFNVSSTIGYAKPVVSGVVGTVTYEVGKEPISAISLEVTPKVQSDDSIVLDIRQIVNNAQSIDKENGLPILSTKDREVKSTIELGDGDSFVISGLNDEKESESVRSTPLVGDIPILGAAFRKTTISKSKSELIVVATVKLVDPLGPGDAYSIPVFKSRNLVESIFNLELKSKTKFEKDGDNFISNIQFIY